MNRGGPPRGMPFNRGGGGPPRGGPPRGGMGGGAPRGGMGTGAPKPWEIDKKIACHMEWDAGK